MADIVQAYTDLNDRKLVLMKEDAEAQTEANDLEARARERRQRHFQIKQELEQINQVQQSQKVAQSLVAVQAEAMQSKQANDAKSKQFDEMMARMAEKEKALDAKLAQPPEAAPTP